MAIVVQLRLDTQGANRQYQQFKRQISSGSGGSNAPRLPVGPFQRQLLAQNAYNSAIGQYGANSIVAQDARLALQRANRAARIASNPQTPAQKAVLQAISSTRFHAGPFSPLIGRSMQALTALGPTAVAAGAAVAGLTIAFEVLKTQIQYTVGSIKEFAAGADAAGSRSFGGANAVGGAYGFDASQASVGFADTLANNPAAMSFFGQHGIKTKLDPYGRAMQDDAELYMQAVKAVRGMSDNDAKMAMRLTGHPEFGQIRDMDQSTFDNLVKAGGKFAPTTQERQTVAKAEGRWETLMQGMGKVRRMMAEPFLNLFNGEIPGLSGAIGQRGPQTIQKDNTKALDENTKAIQDNTRVQSKNAEFFGGGSRARHASPSAARLDVMDRHSNYFETHLGAI